MYFYNYLLLISNILMLTVQTQTQNAKGPGNAACNYYNLRDDDCKLPIASVSAIPDECTSIFYDGIYVDLNYQIYGVLNNTDLNQKTFDELNNVLKCSKPVYLYYGYASLLEWIQALACGGENNYEMKSLKEFFGKYEGISGILLSFIENKKDSTQLAGFSENLKKYLDVMKTTFPELQIGIQLDGHFLLDTYTDSQTPWLDIKALEPVTDFFDISVTKLNDCIDESLYNSGIAPMTSSTTEYTMEKIKGILPGLSIPKEKLYFGYTLNPKSNPKDLLTMCVLNIQTMCDYPSDTCLFCSDTMESFYEKGQFACTYGAGFIAGSIIYNDPENKCKCEKPFGSFYALLNGINGGEIPCCELFPRK